MRKKVKRFITFLLAFLLLLNTTTLSAMAEVQLTVPVDESILAKRPDLYEPSEEDLKNQIAMVASTGDYRSWAQGDSRWGSIRLGSSSYTVANSGCLVTSVTKLIIQAGLRNSSDFNVATFVNAMNSKGGFTSSGDMYWGTPANIVSGFTNYGELLSYSTYSSSNYNSQIINWINAGYHLVLNVKSGGHWIAVDEAKTLATGQVYIMDSLSGSANADITLTSRYSTFNKVHAYKGGKLTSLEHTCNKGTYKWIWDAHPHYKCYQCSVCGEIKEFRDEPTQLNTCDQCRPGKPVLNVSVGSNGVATFTWDATSNTTHYNMWLLKKDSAGKYNCIKQFFEVESGFSYAIDSGEYCAQLLSYSSNMWEPDDSDWVHTWAMDKYFSYGKNKITFHADGGTLPTAVLSDTIDGINVERAARALVAYDNDGAPRWTNKYGAEVAVNDQGRIVAIREYGDENQLTIPEGGFVLSGHADWDEEQQKHVGGVNFIEDIFRYYRADPQSVYVGLNFETGKVSVFDSYESYITNHKYLSNGETYGSMPVPERDGYVFDGWFTAASGGTEIKWDSTYSVSEVYAHWVEETKASPSSALWDEQNNKYYERFEYGMSWEEAEVFCESQGGHLLTINDATEQSVLVDTGFLNNTRRDQYYVGITDRAEEGKWMLVTGQQATYTNWDKDVPECNGGIRENYTVMVARDYAPYYTAGEWLDVPNDDVNGFHSACNTGFLCEYDLVTIIYDANGGVGGPIENQLAVGHQKMNLSNRVPTRSGYQFKGWSTSATATAAKYQPGERFVAEGPLTLYAVWEKDIQEDTTAPKITNITVSDVTEDGYTVTCTVTDDTKVLKVLFPTWTHDNGQDDLGGEWKSNPKYVGTINGDTVTYRVNVAEHNNESGLYYTHIYAYDTAGNERSDLRTVITLDGKVFEPLKTVTYENHKYEIYGIPEDEEVKRNVSQWMGAKTYCESLGGQLATFESAEEWAYIKAQLPVGADGYWLGATDEVTEGTWKWINGQTLTFGDWASGQPDNYNVSEGKQQHYLVARFEGFAWDDDTYCPSNKFYGFVCEYDIQEVTISYNANGGSGAPSAQTVTEGSSVTIPSTVPTRTGYKFKGWGTSSTETVATHQPGDTYMVDRNVTLYAIWEKEQLEDGYVNPFSDVSDSAWYTTAVRYVHENGIMSGNNGLFNPTGNITRAQLVTTLYRLAGSPKVLNKQALTDFTDVAEGKYYTDAVCWAYATGVGTGNGDKFNPTGQLTRQQLAAFFYRFAEYQGADITVRSDISKMEGADKVSGYAKDAVEWAVGAGLISGSKITNANGETVYDLKPKDNTTRAQVAVILQRFCENNGL